MHAIKLFKRKGSKNFYVRYVVPLERRALTPGSAQRWASTRTSDLRRAKAIAGQLYAELQDRAEADYRAAKELSEKADQVVTSADAPEDLPEVIDEVVRRINDPRDDFTASDGGSVIEAKVTRYLSAQNAKTAHARRSYRAAFNDALHVVGSAGQYWPLEDAIQRHLEDRKPVVNPSTLDRKEKVLNAFKDWMGERSVSDVSRLDAGRYLDERLKGSPDARWNLQALSAAWNFFVRRTWADSNVWAGYGKELKGSTRGSTDRHKRRPWNEEEVLRLVEAIRDQPPRLNKLDLRALLLIGLYTGARREEIAGAHIDNVSVEYWSIVVKEAKNQNSIRAIPIHPVIRPLVRYLKENSENGMLLPGVRLTGRDGRYGKKFDNRTTFVIRKYVSEDKKVVFHSLRNTIERAMVKAGVPMEKYEQITGHRTQHSMSFDEYAQGTDLEDLHDQIAKVDYGKAQRIAIETIRSIADQRQSAARARSE